jgi:hypothetical protein
LAAFLPKVFENGLSNIFENAFSIVFSEICAALSFFHCCAWTKAAKQQIGQAKAFSRCSSQHRRSHDPQPTPGQQLAAQLLQEYSEHVAVHAEERKAVFVAQNLAEK